MAKKDDLDKEGKPGEGEAGETGAVAKAAPAIKLPKERHGNEASPAARDLLLKACRVFGVNPARDQRPQELLAWTYYGSDEEAGIPAAVSIVTGNARKLKLYADDTLDEETVQALGRVFGLKPHPDGRPWTTADLPESLTLPTVECTGSSGKTDHVYQGGYLKAGGKEAATRRQAIKKNG